MGASDLPLPMSEHMDADIGRILGDGPVGHLHIRGVDRLLGGLRDRLTVIAASPGAGKTTLLGSVLDDAASDGLPCIYFEIEMARRALLAKSLVRLAGGAVSMSDLDGPPGPRALGALREATELYRERIAPRMYVVDGPLDMRDIERHVSAVADAHGRAPVVGVDYVQIVSLPPEMQSSDERAAIRLVFGELRRLVSRHGCPVLAVSSINRTGYDKSSVGLDNLGGCSYIEYGADAVLSLTAEKGRPERPEEVAEAGRPVVLAALKNRYGARGSVALDFDAPHSAFSERGALR